MGKKAPHDVLFFNFLPKTCEWTFNGIKSLSNSSVFYRRRRVALHVLIVINGRLQLFRLFPDPNFSDLRDLARTATCRYNGFKCTRGRASGFIALGRRTLFFSLSLSLFLPTLFLLAYFHAINFSTALLWSSNIRWIYCLFRWTCYRWSNLWNRVSQTPSVRLSHSVTSMTHMSRPASGTQSRKVSCCYVWGLGVPFSEFSFPVLLTRPNKTRF